MKSKFLQGGALIFTLVIGLVFLSSPSHAFWWGDQLDGAIDPTRYEELTRFMEGDPETGTPGVISDMIVSNFGFGGVGYPEEGLIQWNQEKAWGGYTLLSAFGGYCPKGYGKDDEGNDIAYCNNDPEDPEAFKEWWYAILIDMHGNPIHGWPGNAFPAKTVEGGDVLMAQGLQEECYQSPDFVQMDWCGNVKWSWKNEDLWPCEPFEDGTYNPRCNQGVNGDGIPLAYTGQHHDWQREPNPVGYYTPDQWAPPKKDGKTLILSSTVPPLDGPHGTCKDPDNGDCISPEIRMISDAIYEVDSITGDTWAWYDHEHFDKDMHCGGRPGCLGMGFDDVEKKGIAHVRAFIPNDINASDYHHFNSASWLGENKWYSYYGDLRFHPDNIIWDGRQSNITAIIARHDHPDGHTWHSGDIVWRIGPDYGPSMPEGKLGWIIGQHMAHMIPKGLPGEGNILIFDNGGMAGWGSYFEGGTEPAGYSVIPPPMSFFAGDLIHMGSKFRNYSRVIEFNPLHMKIVWEYKSLAPNNDYGINFFSSFISGAQRLANGNTLITEGGPGRIFEVTQYGEIVWEYVHPVYPVASPPQFGAGGGNAVYRAYRIPYHWIPRHLFMDRNHDGVYDVCQMH